MNFDGSKENIQPLRGGRDPQQLEMALQAQTNHEYQLILMRQRSEFESKIQNYVGDDPLQNYYNFILWIEQSYPKNGHEGKGFEVLEQCLAKFENNPIYRNDKRFCKLWIKYIDMFPNPLELYLMMKSKSLCIGCAEFYKAWAYYYEVAGDYSKAHKVIEEGKSNFAQPFEDLEEAQKKLIIAAGEHTIYGPNEDRLNERRQALVSLDRHRSSGTTNSNYGTSSINHDNNIGIRFPKTQASASNIQQQIYKDHTSMSPSALLAAGSAPPKSIISVAKRQEAPKENTMKPRPWNTVPHKKRVLANQKSSGVQFTVHEDDPSENLVRSHLPEFRLKVPIECLEDYSNWHVTLTNDPDEPIENVYVGYPKHRVYCDANKEYSIEEIRANRYKKSNNRPLPTKSIIIDDDVDDDCIVMYQDSPIRQLQSQHHEQNQQQIELEESKKQFKFNLYQRSPSSVNNIETSSSSAASASSLNGHNNNHSNKREMISTIRHSPWKSQAEHQSFLQDVFSKNNEYRIRNDQSRNQFPEIYSNFEIPSDSVGCDKATTAFAIYEETMQEPSPKGNAMKTSFRTLNADEVETGSRGGMEGAMAAQPDADGARAMAHLPFSDDSSSSSIDNGELLQYNPLDTTTNTQQFNFNLNAMQVSTPKMKSQYDKTVDDAVMTLSTKKRLFSDSELNAKALSTIIEEPSGFISSSTSTATTKSSIKQPMKTITEEHNSYLAQNLKANAALRRSLLGGFVDNLENEPPHLEPMITSPNANASPIAASSSFQLHEQSTLMAMDSMNCIATSSSLSDTRLPLNYVPSDPFDPQLITKLLNAVQFPGIHSRGLINISGNPRITVRKDPICLGPDKYIISKVLGKGQFGTVYKATDLKRNEPVALKYQKPPNKWEFYISREVQLRLRNHPLCNRFMDVSVGYFSDQASIIVSQFQPLGSLLDMVNFLKEQNLTKEIICLHFTLEMMKIVKAIHEVKIIHADIKPDNFLVIFNNNDNDNNLLSLQLVDFGRSIDMTLFPNNACFTVPIVTEDFICCEVVDGRPWSYHTDLFCIAASAHVLLFHEYIQLKKQNNIWGITKHFPRYVKNDLWNMFFNTLLNQQSGPADVATLEFLFQEEIEQPHRKRELGSQLRNISNLLKCR